jgi:AraC-like DNA-binding protein
MKVIPFTIPVPAHSSIHVQRDELPVFYPHLHRHGEIQITSIMKGTGTLLCGNTLVAFEPGDVFILGAQLPHVFKSDVTPGRKRNNAAVSVSVFFDLTGSLQTLLQLPEIASIQKWLQKWNTGGKIKGKQAAIVCSSIQQVMEAKGASRLIAFISLLQQISGTKTWQPFGSQHAYISETAGQRIDTVIQYTLKHVTDHIAIDTVAKLIHMTPQAFCRYFKQHTRKTYLNFVTELRIQEACKKLQSSQLESIASVAWDIGFNNIPNFNRVFKKVMGMTPGEYTTQFKQF